MLPELGVVMKVRFLTSIASADWSYGPGDVAELDDRLAEAWMGAGICEPAPTAGPESATDDDYDTAARVTRARRSDRSRKRAGKRG